MTSSFLLPVSTFTDDAVLTVAVADCLLNGKDYARTILGIRQPLPDRGELRRPFLRLAGIGRPKPVKSLRQWVGDARVAVGFACDTLDEVLVEARRSAEVTHNHPEGIKGAQAVAAAIFLARRGGTGPYIREYITETLSVIT